MNYKNYIYSFQAPLLSGFVRWVLESAAKADCKKVYFLARDGYLPALMARVYCEKWNLDIECRYLYCSRMSLRIPEYHLCPDAVFQHIFPRNLPLTYENVLRRSCLDDSECKEVLNSLGIPMEKSCELLNMKKSAEYCNMLKKSAFFRHLISEKAEISYANIIGYFRQEGLFEQNKIYITDSGWLGSIQDSLSHLLVSADFCGKIYGLYFGLYYHPKNNPNSVYNSYYFSPKSSPFKMACFNSNLFEAMLSSPHGMTIGYCKNDSGGYEPVLRRANASLKERVLKNQNLLIEYALSDKTGFMLSQSEERKILRRIRKIIYKYMTCPTEKEVSQLEGITFSRDVTDDLGQPLSCGRQTRLLKEYIIPVRIIRKLIKKKSCQLLWPCGISAYLSVIPRWWYRFNIILWEFLKCCAIKLKVR